MKQKVIINDQGEKLPVDEEGLQAVLKQRPNRKVVFGRFHLGVYNLVNPERQTKAHQKKRIRREKKVDRKAARKNWDKQERLAFLSDTLGWRDWLTNTVGEPPVVFDSTKTQKSADQIKVLLAKNGYFGNEVDWEVKYNRNQRRAKKLKYYVTPGRGYILDSIGYLVKDEGIQRRIDFIQATSGIKQGDLFSVEQMDDERERIATYLNNRGYYAFSKDFITYQADSSKGDHTVDVQMRIRRPQVVVPEYDSLMYVNHKRYFIDHIYIHTNYNALDREYEPTDTLDYGGVHILSSGELDVKPELLLFLLQFQRGDLYQRDKADETYRKLVQLPMFRSANIAFEPMLDEELNLLTCQIYLSQMKRQFVSTEAGVTHRDGLFGLSGSLNFSHRNLLKGAEQAQIRISGAVEAQQPLTLTETDEITGDDVADNIRFNTFEIGPELSIDFYRFFPFRMSRFRKANAPRTTLSAGFNYQNRPDYERQLYQFRYGVSFFNVRRSRSQIFWDIWDLSSIRIDKSTAFNDLLNRINDQFLLTSYQDHLISAGRVAWLYNNQLTQTQTRYLFNRSRLELAGNLPRIGFELAGRATDDLNSYQIGGIRFAQYVKFENDFRYYHRWDEKNQTAFRLFGGVGVPGANLNVLPFEKSFYAGGANGIRAWEPRTLGPGSFRDSLAVVTFNNIGEIHLEANAEYRFKLTQTLEGCFFLDVGNIWFIEEDESRPGSGFDPGTFVDELAWGGGIGLRLDFEFFLLRFDLGAQLRDPAKMDGERWFFQPKNEYTDFVNDLRPSETYVYFPPLNFNLGIGYPF